MNTSKALTFPNSLTLLRILLTPFFVFLVFSESSFWKQIALVVYVVAALTDWYDGWVARKFGYVTRWGKFFDPLADKILSAAALLAFVHLNLIDAWMVWVIVIRDFLITGLRMLAEFKDQPIVTSRTAQAKTFGQFVVIYYILILYVAKSVLPLQERFGDVIEALLHPQVLFGMMLVVTLSNVGTALLYLFDNRTFLERLPAVRFLVKLLATGLFSGYSPIVPGTMGTLVGAVFYLLFPTRETFTLPLVTVVTFFIGVWTSSQLEHELGPDPQIIVIDEIVGMWISVLFLPRLVWIVPVAFFLFRVFDTFKPYPARPAERIGNGWGVMLDDVVAGIYANISVRALLYAVTSSR